MVEIGVTVTDGPLVHGLMRRLRRVFPSSTVTYDATAKQVSICSEWESRAVIVVIDAVQAWLDESGGDTAVLSLGDRTYRLVGSGPGATEIDAQMAAHALAAISAVAR